MWNMAPEQCITFLKSLVILDHMHNIVYGHHRAKIKVPRTTRECWWFQLGFPYWIRPLRKSWKPSAITAGNEESLSWSLLFNYLTWAAISNQWAWHNIFAAANRKVIMASDMCKLVPRHWRQRAVVRQLARDAPVTSSADARRSNRVALLIEGRLNGRNDCLQWTSLLRPDPWDAEPSYTHQFMIFLK